MDDQKRRINDLTDCRDQLTVEKSLLEQELEKKNRDLQSSHDQFEALNKKFTTLGEMNNATILMNKGLTEANNGLKAENQRLQAEVRELRYVINTVRETLESPYRSGTIYAFPPPEQTVGKSPKEVLGMIARLDNVRLDGQENPLGPDIRADRYSTTGYTAFDQPIFIYPNYPAFRQVMNMPFPLIGHTRPAPGRLVGFREKYNDVEAGQVYVVTDHTGSLKQFNMPENKKRTYRYNPYEDYSSMMFGNPYHAFGGKAAYDKFMAELEAPLVRVNKVDLNYQNTGESKIVPKLMSPDYKLEADPKNPDKLTFLGKPVKRFNMFAGWERTWETRDFFDDDISQGDLVTFRDDPSIYEVINDKGGLKEIQHYEK